MSVEAEALQFELLDLVLEDAAESAGLTDHAQCVALSSCLRGKLCEQLASLPPRHILPGERLYRTGNPARTLFLLRSGLVKTSVLSHEGEELTLRIHKPGDILGELCLCGGGRREEAIALEASIVTELPLAALLSSLRREPEAALELASTMCERLSDAYEQLGSLA